MYLTADNLLDRQYSIKDWTFSGTHIKEYIFLHGFSGTYMIGYIWLHIFYGSTIQHRGLDIFFPRFTIRIHYFYEAHEKGCISLNVFTQAHDI
jgi:hypothetical protein